MKRVTFESTSMRIYTSKCMKCITEAILQTEHYYLFSVSSSILNYENKKDIPWLFWISVFQIMAAACFPYLTYLLYFKKLDRTTSKNYTHHFLMLSFSHWMANIQTFIQHSQWLHNLFMFSINLHVLRTKCYNLLRIIIIQYHTLKNDKYCIFTTLNWFSLGLHKSHSWNCMWKWDLLRKNSSYLIFQWMYKLNKNFE